MPTGPAESIRQPFTRGNLVRVTRLWSLVAFAAVPLFLAVGVALLVGVFPAQSSRASVIEMTAAPGAEIAALGGSRGMALWGQPADVDLAQVTCTWTGGADAGGELEVGPAPDRPTEVTDSRGKGDFVWLTTTAGEFVPRSATCSGGGLTTLGASVDPGTGAGSSTGLFFVLLAPVMLVLGLVARRLSRRS
ncbi:hypothetical protein [Pengzhenrongella sicca]|uniref:Uncharacterized protein n=1 Tax=Pengzhenrongella sicca TaxID=2819238 RepID=A0A8A4ZK44_9MICO|nr:hypothetical protein [Pengzhenrongella sicca]QTE29968.1 hypothetical protein J4E96_02775 [Pengzhenrongella sicca]